MLLILPLLISIIIGDIIVDEYTSGTLKLPLLHPVSRKELIVSKVLTIVLTASILLIFILLLSYVLGFLLLPWEDTLEIGSYTFSGFPAVLFVVFSYMFTLIVLVAFVMPIVMLAVRIESTSVLVGSTIGMFVIFQFLTNSLPLPLKQFLIYFYFFITILAGNLNTYKEFVLGATVILAYIVFPYLIALRHFKKKDIMY